MKIYTKTGDKGQTSLFGGKRVDKDSLRLKAYGNIDELNSVLGVILSDKPSEKLGKKLLRIQGELFILGSDLASPRDLKVKVPRLPKSYILRLEKEIDLWEKDLPRLKNFILPGGSKTGAKLHLARTVARRAERFVVSLAKEEKINQNAQVYVNRLSDWLFTLARFVNRQENFEEKIWKGR